MINMQILAFSDLHGMTKELPLLNPDLIFLLGDLDPDEVRFIDQSYSCPKFGVLGNRDFLDLYTDTSVIDVHGRIVQHDGFTIAGFGGCPRYNTKSNQYEEEEVQQFTDSLPSVDFFIAHANPMLQPSNNRTNPHRGFHAFTQYITQKKPRYFLHGHLHKNEVYFVGQTTVYSVYPYQIFEC
jgi:Icc-related predicted phosphoesterase